LGSGPASQGKKKDSSRKPQIIGCYPDENIFKAARLLHKHFIHRLPILQKGYDTSILCILNHQSIMRFLLESIPPNKDYLLSLPISTLNVGWFDDITFRSSDTLLIDCVHLLNDRTIPAVPILNQENKLIDAFSRSDIRFLVADEHIRDTCESTVESFLQTHHQGHWIPRCTLQDSLLKVITRMLDTRKHSCLVTEDDNETLKGLITLRHIFSFFFPTNEPELVPEPHEV